VTLAAVGGYVDAVGYVMLRGLFPNHVTGNLPIAAAHGGVHVLPALLMVPVWLVGVMGVAGVAGQVRRRDPSRVVPTVLALEAGLLGGFLVLGVSLVPGPDASTPLTQTIVTGAGVLAMAAQSVVSRLAGYAYPTTMVTGTLTLLGMDGAQLSPASSPTTTAPACWARSGRWAGRWPPSPPAPAWAGSWSTA
jgi:uncharacterized membrane protein YoaK (UPF0700 family)